MSFDPNPYSASSTQPTTPKKSNVLTYVLLGIAGALLVLCCGCGGTFAFFFNVGATQAAKAVRPQLQADPVVQQHLGDLETVEVNLGSLMTEAQKNPQRHEGRNMAFKVKGNKGEGVVIGRFDQQGDSGRLSEGELVLPSGEFFPLSP